MIARIFTLFLMGLGFAVADKPVVLFVIGEHEYGTARTLPEFARKDLRDYETRFVFAKSDDRRSPDCHLFPGLAKALPGADVLFLSVRRRFPPKDEMTLLKQWAKQGKPIIALRTSSHAFAPQRQGTGYLVPEGHEGWPEFDREVLGVDYLGHYGGNTEAVVEPVDPKSPLITGIGLTGRVRVASHLYQSRNLDPRADLLLQGSLQEGGPSEPVAWIYGRTFYTSLGGESDLKQEWFRALLRKAVAWAATEQGQADEDPPNPGAGTRQKEGPLTPPSALEQLQTPDDLVVDLVAAEPTVEQPSFLNFDERGRMWVTQYRQYPHPAGLRGLSHDQHFRTIYDRVPHPPGHPGFVPGADRITIHEDTNGDGQFDQVTPFLEGLNMVTSFVRGSGGVWVLNPPYLLFYSDENDDDVPDGKPVVHLSGFGLEDSHSYAMALNWGPDGWLYGSQGSTVTSAIRVTGSDAEPVRRAGQLIWRYHPESRRYEVFAEGGGNIWSCEFDAKGRVHAGSNGRHPGFFYLQGAYYQKNFGKHGELSNPHAYGYFPGIEHPGFKRVSTAICLYEGDALPGRYQGALMWANPILGKVGASRLARDGLGVRSQLLDHPLTSGNLWFRPVYLDFGPDGAVYVCDWCDRQVNHLKNYQGTVSKKDGRIYRIRSKSAKPMVPFDLRRKTTAELVEQLSHPNRWYRETARRLIADRPDRRALIPALQRSLSRGDGQLALESLWTLNLCGAPAYPLNHRDPHVRRWAVRLLGDTRAVTKRQRAALVALAAREPDLAVRGQIASSAGRLPVDDCLPILEQLLTHRRDAADSHLPLLIWWALEGHCQTHADEVVAWARSASFYPKLRTFLARRLVSEGGRAHLRAVATLLKESPDDEAREAVLAGIEQGFQGQSMQGLPQELVAALAQAGGGSVALQLRLGSPGALAEALALLKDEDAPVEAKIRVIEVFGEVPDRKALKVLLTLALESDRRIRLATYPALMAYRDPRIGAVIAPAFPKLGAAEQAAARALLTSRVTWSKTWLKTDPRSVPPEAVAEMKRHGDAELNAALASLNGSPPHRSRQKGADGSAAELATIIAARGGDPYAGRAIYLTRCGSCHSLHHEGGAIGPDLTSYQRSRTGDLLRAILEPSAEIREGYETIVVRTNDGRTLSGFRAEENEQLLKLRPAGGQAVVFKKEEIKSITAIGDSLMPSGLLAGLTNEEIQDLFGYLRTTQPLNIKKR